MKLSTGPTDMLGLHHESWWILQLAFSREAAQGHSLGFQPQDDVPVGLQP